MIFFHFAATVPGIFLMVSIKHTKLVEWPAVVWIELSSLNRNDHKDKQQKQINSEQLCKSIRLSRTITLQYPNTSRLTITLQSNRSSTSVCTGTLHNKLLKRIVHSWYSMAAVSLHFYFQEGTGSLLTRSYTPSTTNNCVWGQQKERHGVPILLWPEPLQQDKINKDKLSTCDPWRKRGLLLVVEFCAGYRPNFILTRKDLDSLSPKDIVVARQTAQWLLSNVSARIFQARIMPRVNWIPRLLTSLRKTTSLRRLPQIKSWRLLQRGRTLWESALKCLDKTIWSRGRRGGGGRGHAPKGCSTVRLPINFLSIPISERS